MSLTASAKAGSSMPLIEAGTHPAVCYGIIDIGEQYNEKYDKASRKCVVMFELPGETFTDKDGNEKSRTMSQTYTMSLNEKSALYKDLVNWRGKPFTDDELRGFNLRNIIGVPCLLSIVHTERNGSTYANINGIMKMPKGMGNIIPSYDEIIFDLDDDPLEKLDSLPEWIVKRIKESVTYKERTAGAGHSDGETNMAQPVQLTELDDDEGELPF